VQKYKRDNLILSKVFGMARNTLFSSYVDADDLNVRYNVYDAIRRIYDGGTPKVSTRNVARFLNAEGYPIEVKMVSTVIRRSRLGRRKVFQKAIGSQTNYFYDPDLLSGLFDEVCFRYEISIRSKVQMPRAAR
jgi:hypothetical protein